MGSLSYFRPMGHPHSLKLSTIHTKKRVLYPFNLPNITARLTRTRNQTSFLVLAQKNNDNGRNPEKKLGSSDNSLNVGSNGILPKKERVAQRKRGKKNQKPSVLGETFTVVLEILKLLVSSCIYTLQRLKNSIKFEFNWQNLKDVVVGLLCIVVEATLIFPIHVAWRISWLVLINVLKIYAVIGIVCYGYLLLTS